MITRRFFLLTCTLSLSSWYHEQQVAEASNDLPSSQPLTWKSSSGEAVKDRAVPQLLVISFDGFRYDYFDLVPIRSLRAFSQRGVHARRGMKPSFPTVTISSHYTIATGLYPESHGIVSNNFYDPVTNTSFSPKSREQHFFDKGEPIWVTAKRQGKRTAVINWFGGQVDWGNESPDIAPPFSNNVSLRDRVDQVIKFLQEDKMDLVMLYYNQPDRAGHTFGSLSNEVFMELEIIDRELDRMFQIMEKRQMTDNVNIIILSDHGMMNLTSEPYILIKVDDWEMEKNTDAIVVSDAIAHFFLKSGGEDREKIVINHLKNLQRSRGHFNVYTKRDIPERWHYRNNPRIGSVIVVADPGYYLIAHRGIDPPSIRGLEKANHGYDNDFEDMRPVFMAAGPDFKRGYTFSDTFQNTNVYSLMSRLMRIGAPQSNGSYAEVSHLVRHEIPEVKNNAHNLPPLSPLVCLSFAMLFYIRILSFC